MFIWTVVFFLFIWKFGESSGNHRSPECPNLNEKWHDFGGEYCYFIETEKKTTWYEAQYQCMRRGGNLASIHSERVGSMIQPYVKNKGYSLFIGLLRLITDENTFVWADGSDVDYINWNKNEPNWMDEKCGEILTDNMKWNDVMCHNTMGYICSVRKALPKVPESPKQSDCPTDKGKEKEKGNTVHACENNQLTLSCEEGRVIHVIRANYGRLSRDLCNDDGEVQWSGEDCMAYSSFSIVNDRCGQKQTCTVEASTRVFGDQCPGTIKYLEVHHDCLPPRK